jgi:hypothetical protein
MANTSMFETSNIAHESLTLVNSADSVNSESQSVPTRDNGQDLSNILKMLKRMDKKLNKIDSLKSRLVNDDSVNNS